MKLHKLMTLFLVLVMLLSLAACEEKPSAEENRKSQTADNDNGQSSANENEQSSSDDEQHSALPSMNTNVTIEETVVVEQKGVKITAKSLSFTEEAACLEIFIENNTDKEVCISSDDTCSVNNWMWAIDYIDCDLLSGETTTERIEFKYCELAMCGISELYVFELGFDIYDPNDYYDIYDFSFTDRGQIRTSAYTTHDYSTESFKSCIRNPALAKTMDYELLYLCEEVDYDVDGVKIRSAAFVQYGEKKEQCILLEIVNNSDEYYELFSNHVIINGLSTIRDDASWETYAWKSGTIMPHKSRVQAIKLYEAIEKSELEVMGIDTIRDVTIFLTQEGYGWDTIKDSVINLTNPHHNVTSYDATGTELYNKKGIRIVSKALIEEESETEESKYIAYLLVENRSDEQINFELNGHSITINKTTYSCSHQDFWTYPGENHVAKIILSEAELKEIGINSIEEIKEISFLCAIDRNTLDIDEQIVINYP